MAVVGGFVVFFTWVILVLRRLAATSDRVVLSSPEQTAEMKFLGGVLARTLNATWGLARLELFDWGVQVRGTKLVIWLIPTWQARYQEIANAQLVTVPVANKGVRLQLCNGGDPVIFWTCRGVKVLDQLEVRGVHVDRELCVRGGNRQ